VGGRAEREGIRFIAPDPPPPWTVDAGRDVLAEASRTTKEDAPLIIKSNHSERAP
jgi:hypothetical protein